jgi:O-antigen/teichoic acid export membrane protein
VAEKLGSERRDDLPALVWTASVLMLIVGTVGAVVLWLSSPFLVTRTFRISAEIMHETIRTFYLLAAAVPMVISTSGLRGILEAHQRFDLTSILRFSMGVFTFLGPLLILPFSRNLFWITLVLVVGRLVAWCCHLLFCIRVMPELRSGISIKLTMIPLMLKFGGWVTVSSIVSPLTVYLDRFLIGALISVTAVAYYATPWEIVTKFLVVPGAVVAVLFPAFSAAMIQDPIRADLLYQRGLKYVFLILFPLTLLVVLFAKEGLYHWLGPEFAENGFRSMQLIAIGTLVIGIATIPFAFIQGMGRPDLTAKLHMVEVIFYVPCAWWLISTYGVFGAAIAWLLHAVVEALVLLVVANRYLYNGKKYLRWQAVCSVISLGVLALAMIPVSTRTKGLTFLVMLAGFVWFSWFRILQPEEKNLLGDVSVAFIRRIYSKKKDKN